MHEKISTVILTGQFSVFSRVACFFISVETVSRYDRLVVDRFSLWFISAVRTSGDDEFFHCFVLFA